MTAPYLEFHASLAHGVQWRLRGKLIPAKEGKKLFDEYCAAQTCERPISHAGVNAAHRAFMDRLICGCAACVSWRALQKKGTA